MALGYAVAYLYLLWDDPLKHHQKSSSVNGWGTPPFPSKGSLLNAFKPDDKSVIVPKKDLNVILPLIEEDEECAREELLWKELLYKSRKSIKAFSYIDRLLAEEKTSIAWNG